MRQGLIKFDEHGRWPLREIVALVASMRPGQELWVTQRGLKDIHCNPPWKPPDMVLENIPGAAFEYWYRWDPLRCSWRFGRLSAPTAAGSADLRTYVSPDRRQYYRLRADGLYEYCG